MEALPTHPVERLHRFTRAEYERFVDLGLFEGERIELLHGMIVEMSPHSALHDGTIQLLDVLLKAAVGHLAAVRVQSAFALSDDSEPEPDIAVVPPGRYLVEHPSVAWLIVEVGVSSLVDDRDLKGPAYARAGVPEYWVVDPAGERIHRFTGPGPGRYAREDLVDLTRPVSFVAIAEATADLSGLFAP